MNACSHTPRHITGPKGADVRCFNCRHPLKAFVMTPKARSKGYDSFLRPVPPPPTEPVAEVEPEEDAVLLRMDAVLMELVTEGKYNGPLTRAMRSN